MQKRRRHKSRKNYGNHILLVLIALVIFVAAYQIISSVQSRAQEETNTQAAPPPSDITPPPTQPPVTTTEEALNINFDFSYDSLYSPYAILIRLRDGKVMLDKESGEKIFPASLTKIMTALVAIENLDDLNKKILLPKSMFQHLYESNAARAGFLPGDKVAAIDLLYGNLLPSGAECSMALALQISGSEEKFVRLMNEKAKELGMEGTHFTNVDGLHDAEHYTTVKDMAVLLEAALKNDTFRKIFTSARHSTQKTELSPDGITFRSTMFAKMESSIFEGGEILGGKTGYTDEAGLCLASLAVKNGEEYILVTTGAPGDSKTEQFNITDAFAVYRDFLK